jgi:putative tryptophan/tyrosine transport system substrate-binding protein
MRRREFITILGGAATAWPLAARAQQPDRVRRIGLLLGIAENDPEADARVTAFRQGLQELGWVEGRNIRIDSRFAASEATRIRAYVAELMALSPDVFVANSTPVLAALRQATSSIPIVFAVVNDPVGQGFISSLARPGGNITGFTFIEFAMVGKWLQMLKEVAPAVARAGIMFNPQTAPYYDVYLRSFEAMPRSIAVELTAAPVRDGAEIEAVIAKLGREPGGGLIVPPDPFTLVHRETIVKSAEQHRLPVVWSYRQFVTEGALMSYGPDTADIFRRSASYVDLILKGAKPADLPAQSPSKFELVINLKTAKALGLEIPPTLLARADEVIE